MCASRRRRAALTAIKTVHTLIWFTVEASMGYLLYAGIRGRSDRRAAIAAAVVGVETFVFLGNGARCPLTGVAESLGAGRGSVTDIFLPRWFARNLPAIHVPLIAAAAFLHGRSVQRHRQGGATGDRREPTGGAPRTIGAPGGWMDVRA